MPQFLRHTPAVLYKYRGDIPRDVPCLLEQRELYLASPATLNDPFDCYPFLQIPAEAELQPLIEAEVASVDPSHALEMRRRCELLISSRSARVRFMRELYDQDISKLGVLSLSVPRDHPLLWAHYARNASGFAVGYRARDDNAGEAIAAIPVRYRTDRPRISPLGPVNWLHALFTKPEPWSYEQEWRYVRTPEDGGAGVMTVPQGAIVEVCLGPRMSQPDRQRTIAAARLLPDEPRVLQAVLHLHKYEMEFELLD